MLHLIFRKRGAAHETVEPELDANKYRKGENAEKIPSTPPLVEAGARPFPIYALQETLITFIFSFLTPHQVLKASKIGKLFYAIANDPLLWRHYVNCYFRNSSMQSKQFAAGPKAFFIHQYRCLLNLITHTKGNFAASNYSSYILDALWGYIPEVNPQSDNFLGQMPLRMKQILLALAQANGHNLGSQALHPKFQHLADALTIFLGNGAMLDYEKRGIGRAIIKGNAAKGKVDAIQRKAKWIDTLGSELTLDDIGDALVLAAKCGHIEFVQSLLYVGNPIPYKFKKEAAKEAVKQGHFYLVLEMLKNVGNWLSKDDIGILFIVAIIHKQDYIVEYLIANYHHKISASTKAFAMALKRNEGSNPDIRHKLKYYSSRIDQDIPAEPEIDCMLPLLESVGIIEEPAPVLMLGKNKHTDEESSRHVHDEGQGEPCSFKRRRA